MQGPGGYNHELSLTCWRIPTWGQSRLQVAFSQSWELREPGPGLRSSHTPQGLKPIDRSPVTLDKSLAPGSGPAWILFSGFLLMLFVFLVCFWLFCFTMQKIKSLSKTWTQVKRIEYYSWLSLETFSFYNWNCEESGRGEECIKWEAPKQLKVLTFQIR